MKRKGFTLIELLAVIVILAIIALITTPIVMNVIENTRKGAAERSADNYLRAVETAIATERLDGPVEDGTYIIDADGNLNFGETKIEVEIKGSRPNDGGSVSIIDNAIVDSYLVVGEYSFTGSKGNLKLVTGIDIETEEQLYALQRTLLTNKLRTAKGYSEQTYEDDFKLFDIPSAYDTTEKKIEYLRTSTFNLKNDLTVNFTRLDASNQFMAIGTSEYPFSGTFNGNNHTITLTGGDLKLSNDIDENFGLFGYVENANISALNIKVESDIIITQSVTELNYGLLSGKASNSTINNINLSLNSANVGVNYSDARYRAEVNIGSLIGNSNNNKFLDINVNLENSKLINNNSNSSDSKFYLIGGLISSSNYDNINNVNINLKNSEITSKTNTSPVVYISGMIAEAKYTSINNSNLVMNNSSIGGELENGISTDKYNNILAGGIIGFGHAGSDNSEATIGNKGVIIKNTKVTINNTQQMDSIYARETSGSSVNVGGIMALTYNNSEIENCELNVTNGNLVAYRGSTNDTTHENASGALAGGIVGRLEHTGRIYNSKVIGNNLVIEATGNEAFNGVGGIVAIDMGPSHRNVISIENCSFEGNNTSVLKLNLSGEESVNTSSIGGIAGQTTYISKNNAVKNATIELNNTNTSNSAVYASQLFGYFNRSTFWTNTEYFTPNEVRGIIDTTFENITLDIEGSVANSNKYNGCGYYIEY